MVHRMCKLGQICTEFVNFIFFNIRLFSFRIPQFQPIYLLAAICILLTVLDIVMRQ